MTDLELERRARRRLAVLRHAEEVSGNVAATSRVTTASAGSAISAGWVSSRPTASRD